MLTFIQYLREYSDAYYQKLPPATPPESVAAAQHRFGLDNEITWKVLDNDAVHQSEEVDGGIICMKPGDRLENWFHELGHEVFDHCDKEKVKPILTIIRDTYRVHNKDYEKKDQPKVKTIELGGMWYGYSHSGKEYEYDELFAVTFAWVMTGHKFEDKDINDQYMTMLKGLEA